MIDQKIAIIITIIFLASVFVMFLLHGVVRKSRRVYRFGHSFTTVMGIIAAVLLTFCDPNDSMDNGAKIIFIIFVFVVGVPTFLYNFWLFIKGEGEILTSTLTNITVKEIRGGKIRQRISYRVDGTSLEGNKDSFSLKYPDDKKAVTQAPVTSETQIRVQYYSNSYSIYSVTRIR